MHDVIDDAIIPTKNECCMIQPISVPPTIGNAKKRHLLAATLWKDTANAQINKLPHLFSHRHKVLPLMNNYHDQGLIKPGLATCSTLLKKVI